MQNNELFGTNPNEKGLQLFNFNNSPVRTLTHENGDIYFVASDVCRILDISNVSQAISRLDEDEKNDIILNDVVGKSNKFIIINESGLYSLVLSSRKAEAKAFKKWVTSEVLPQIRKTGAYLPKSLTPAEMILAQVHQLVAQEQRLTILEAKVESINTEYYTLAGFYNLKKMSWNLSLTEAQKVGTYLKGLSYAEGVVVLKCYDAKYGEVNSYRKDILEKYFMLKK